LSNFRHDKNRPRLTWTQCWPKYRRSRILTRPLRRLPPLGRRS